MAVSVVSFSFSMVAQPEHWLSLLHLVYLLNSTRLSPLARWTQLTGTQLVGLILPSNSHALIWTRLHDYFRHLGTGICHFRFLWNGLCDRHRAEITVIQFRDHSLPMRQSMRGARGVIVTVAGIGHGDTSSNPWLIAFHIALIPLGKVWIQLFSLQLWVNSRAD